MGTEAVRFLLVWLAGRINSRQLEVIDFLREENRVLREQLGRRRLRFTDDQRRRIAVKGKTVGRRRLGEFAGLVTPETILRWYRELIARKSDGSARRRTGAQRSPLTWNSSSSGWRRRTELGLHAAGRRARQSRPSGRPQHSQARSPAAWFRASTRARKRMPWKTFLRTHLGAIAAADFFAVEVLTLTGLVRYFVLFVIDLQTRRVQIGGVVRQAYGAWMNDTVRPKPDVDPFPIHLRRRGDAMSSTSRSWLAPVPTIGVLLLVAGGSFGACSSRPTGPRADLIPPNAGPRADLIVTNARVYTLAWGEPAGDGTPAANAPRGPAGWTPDAQAVAIRGSRIVFVGSNDGAAQWRGPTSRVIDLHGATLLPGLVDSHVHIVELGRMLERVNLVGVDSEAEAVEKVAARAAVTPKGEWILGYGWDDGAWSSRYPTLRLLSERVPDHPVYLRGLHGYAVWGNQLAFERAKITPTTRAPAGGEIRKDASGRPSGVLVNAAVELLESAIPRPTAAQIEALALKGLEAMADAGYVAVHEAGADSELMAAFEHLAATGRLPVRVYAMLSGRDHPLLERWLEKGRETPAERQMLTTLGVKVFFDGALGSRGARLIAPYADRPRERGVPTPETGFDPKLIAAMMKAGFQANIHAIGDAANREALDFVEAVVKDAPSARNGRHRIEHAQVLDARDVPRFATSGVIASMQPPHAVEDMVWAEDRLGPDRVKLAYAWRTLRRSGAHLVFSSDLPGTAYDVFYGLHSAITRQDRAGKPEGGWHAEQRMTPEEALRGYTTWAAYAAFAEDQTGALAVGRWADLTAMDIDPLNSGEKEPARLLAGKIRMTIVAGRIVKSSSEF